MESDIEGVCPSLADTASKSRLGLSTYNRTVGTSVRFFCPDSTLTLFGSEVTHCLENGLWNGSIPTCSHLANQTILGTDTSTITTEGDGSAEFKVETVIIILWIAGGALIITLLIFIGCILRSHKKTRQNISGSRTRMFGLRGGRSDPRHGGVNPSFTTYDEIWTWIPVVTGNQENCAPHINTSAREISPELLNRITSSLHDEIRPPTYSEATQNSPEPLIISSNTQVANTNAENPYETITDFQIDPQNASTPYHTPDIRRARRVPTVSERVHNTGTPVSSDNVHNSASAQDNRHVTNINVQRSISATRNSTQPDNMRTNSASVNNPCPRRTSELQSPLPGRNRLIPSCPSSSQNESNSANSNLDQNQNQQVPKCKRGPNQTQIHIRQSQQLNQVPSPSQRRTPTQRASPSNRNINRNRPMSSTVENREYRRGPYTLYPQYTRDEDIVPDSHRDGANANNTTNRNPAAVQSENSGFTYLAGNRRVYCDIPPSLWDEDAPPPYNNNNVNRSSDRRHDRPAPIVRMECEYF